MDFRLSPEQTAFQKTAREFAAKEFAPHAAAWDRDKIFPVAALRKAAALGFGGHGEAVFISWLTNAHPLIELALIL